MTNASEHSIPAVHMTENLPDVTRNRKWSGYPYPLGEPDRPGRTGTTPAERVADILNIVHWLDVQESARYQKKKSANATYCNVYAYDLCYLASVYISRVWWTRKALAAIRKGESVVPNLKNKKTVGQMSANRLYVWLNKHGPSFGWRPVSDLSELQQRANEGQIGIMSAQRRDRRRSGHITVVVPEHGQHRAIRTDGAVTCPLQSQAGDDNYMFHPRLWWQDEKYSNVSFWLHL